MSTPDGRSLGAFRVRESFNPSESNTVDKIKRFTADLIDLCQELENIDAGSTTPEQTRLCRLAMTHYEIACMFGVKAATTAK
jgi:hypothetical protein